MKNLFSMERIVAGAAAACLLLAGLSARAAVYDWTNTSGGNWSNTNNWSPNQVPSTNDTANITVAGAASYTVTLDISPTVASLVLGASSGVTTQIFSMGGNTFTVNGPIEVNAQGQFNLNGGELFGTNVLTGALTWSGGNIAGNMTVTTNSFFNIVAGGGDGFRGLVLSNYGTVTWTNTILYGINQSNAQIYNYGTWNAQSDNTFHGGNNGLTTLFDNFGTFVKSGNTGATVLDASVVFNNTGTVDVESGTLDIEGGGASTNCGFTTADGATLNFATTGYTFSNTNTFTGLGSYVTAGATFGGTVVGTLTLSGASTIFNGVLTLPTNSVLNIVTANSTVYLRGLALTNYGTVNWTNTTLEGYQNLNAQIYNYGMWNAQSDNTFIGANSVGTTLFDNFGTFVKSGNTGVTTLNGTVVFNNTGTVTVESGTLDIGGGTSISGSFGTASGASLNFIATA
jgi:hypothetical protein